MSNEWDADFLHVEDSLACLDDRSLADSDLVLLQYRRWPDFEMMIARQSIRFRRADTFNTTETNEGIVHERVRQAFSDPADAQMLRTLQLAKFLYISCFTTQEETNTLWSDFAPEQADVCLVTRASDLFRAKPDSVVMTRVEYGVDGKGANPSDQIFQDKIDYEQICTLEGLEYEEHGDFSFAQPLKYLLSRYRYQEEVRLIYSPVSTTLDGYSTWASFAGADYGSEIEFVEFPFSGTFSEVRVRSDAPDGHVARVKKLLLTVNWRATVVQSALP